VSRAEPLAVAVTVAVAWTAVVLAAQIMVFHFARVERRARALVLLFAAAIVAEIASCRALGVDGWRALCGVVIIACAFILYMPAYYTVAASFSARMLRDLAAAPRGLTWDELAARDPAAAIIAGRLSGMTAAGYVVSSGDGYALTAKGALVARSFVLVKRLWRLGPGG
jgi:hypothetical protein